MQHKNVFNKFYVEIILVNNINFKFLISMKKISFLKTIMLAVFAILASVTYGQTATITITMATIDPTNALATNGYNSGAERTWTQSSVDFGGKAICPNQANTPVNPTAARAYIQAQASNGVIYNTTALPGRIVSITLNYGGTAQNSLCYGGTERLVNSTAADYNVTNGTQVGAAGSAGWTSTDFAGNDYTFFAIKRSTGTSYFSSIVIEYETGSAPTEPTSAAPVPTRLASDVMSVFSDSYPTVSWFNYGGWGQQTEHSIVQYGGNNTMKLINFDYQGFEFAGAGGALHITTMDSLHVDVWTADETSFQIGIADPTVPCTPLVQGVWNSFDIPITALVGTNDLNNIGTMKLVGSGNTTVYVDNIYFYKQATAAGQVAVPVITPSSTTFNTPVTVSITCATDGATIHYTTDGSTPTASSTAYSAPLTISATTTVNAIAMKDAMTNSDMATATYTFVALTDPVLIDDFESGDKGWATVGCYEDIRTNAYPEGLNTSAHVLFTNRGTGNDDWSGAILSAAGLPVSPITGFQYLHALMYRNNTNNPNLKVNDGCGGDILPMAGITIVANEWQDVVFDLGTCAVNYVMFMVDRTIPLPAEAWMLVDDIILTNDPTPRTLSDEQVIYQTGFEASEGFTAGSTYNNTAMAFTGPTASQWGTIYGTPSTQTPITDLQSMQMRWYTTATTTFGSTETRFNLPYATKVTFKAKNTVVGGVGMDITAQYSTDGGSTWTGDQVFTLGTTAADYTYNISATGEFPNVRVKFTVHQSGTAPTGTVQVIIDNVVVYGITGLEPSQVEIPEFDPAGGTFSAPVNVSLTCATEGATIYYTTDGNDPTTSSTQYTTPLNISETTTVKAIGVKDGMDNSDIASETYTVLNPEDFKTYSLITSTAELVAGAKYLIVSATDGSARAMSKKNGTNNRNTSDVTISSGSITTIPASVIDDGTAPYEITLGGEDGAWTLYDEVYDGYLKAASSASNYLYTSAGSADWTITFDVDNSAVLTCTTGDFSHNLMRYNASNNPPLISCYASGQSPLYLFKEVASSSVETPVISPASGTYNDPITVSITCATAGASIYYTTDGTTPTASSNEYAATPFSVSTTTTVKAVAILGTETSNVATATYTFPPSVPNIAAYIETTEPGNVRITGAVTVVYQNGQYLFVQDDSGYLLVYGTLSITTLQNGDVLTGLTGTLSIYHGLPEMTNAILPTPTSGSVVSPTEYDLANFVTSDISRYVKVVNVQFTADVNFASATPANTGYLVSPENFVVYNRFNIPVSVTAGLGYNITGFLSYYDAPQLYYITIEPTGSNTDFNLSNSINIYSKDGNIMVDNAKAGEMITVYNVAGQKIANKVAADGTNTIATDVKGVLIVRCGQKTGKIIL